MKKYRSDIRDEYGDDVWRAVLKCIFGNYNSVNMDCYKKFVFRNFIRGCKL